jgi:hypothetical protein
MIFAFNLFAQSDELNKCSNDAKTVYLTDTFLKNNVTYISGSLVDNQSGDTRMFMSELNIESGSEGKIAKIQVLKNSAILEVVEVIGGTPLLLMKMGGKELICNFDPSIIGL